MPPADSIEKTGELRDLFAVAAEQRDESWRRKFYTAAPDAAFMRIEPQIREGPDTFPHLDLALPATDLFAPFSIDDAVEFVLDRGAGIAIFATPDRTAPPQWVFTYGDLVSYRLFGNFEGGPPESGPVQFGGDILVGSPSEQFLPGYARKVLGNFMRNVYRHPDPKVALISDQSGAHGLMLNLTLDQYDGDDGKLSAALHYVGWYLPRNYRVTAMPTGWSDSNFAPLA